MRARRKVSQEQILIHRDKTNLLDHLVLHPISMVYLLLILHPLPPHLLENNRIDPPQLKEQQALHHLIKHQVLGAEQKILQQLQAIRQALYTLSYDVTADVHSPIDPVGDISIVSIDIIGSDSENSIIMAENNPSSSASPSHSTPSQTPATTNPAQNLN